jgi:hypothetical protein
MIELEAGATPVITAPYRHPKKFKDEIEKAIKELLAMGHIRPSMSPFASSVSPGTEEGWHVTDVHRLQSAQQENDQESLPHSTHR